MNILGVDPGNEFTGFCLTELDPVRILLHGKLPNDKMVRLLRKFKDKIGVAVFEMPVIHGSNNTVRDTILWTGRFIQVCEDSQIKTYTRFCRSSVRGRFLKKSRISRYPAAALVDGADAKITAVMTQIFGNKVQNVTADAWQALALCCCFIEKVTEKEIDDQNIAD
jgi:hypothetical protein